MPFTTSISPSSARIATSATFSASPEPAPASLGSGGGKALVAIGGGTGLSALLRGLKHHVGTDRLRELAGVVTVTDDGGSSGRLRKEFGVLPPGTSATASPPSPTTRICSPAWFNTASPT